MEQCQTKDGEYTCIDDKLAMEEMCEVCHTEFIDRLVIKEEYTREEARDGAIQER